MSNSITVENRKTERGMESAVSMSHNFGAFVEKVVLYRPGLTEPKGDSKEEKDRCQTASALSG